MRTIRLRVPLALEQLVLAAADEEAPAVAATASVLRRRYSWSASASQASRTSAIT